MKIYLIIFTTINLIITPCFANRCLAPNTFFSENNNAREIFPQIDSFTSREKNFDFIEGSKDINISLQEEKTVVNVMQRGLAIVKTSSPEDISLITRDVRTCSSVAYKGNDRWGNTILALSHIVQRPSAPELNTFNSIFAVVNKLIEKGAENIQIALHYDPSPLAKTYMPEINEMNSLLKGKAEIIYAEKRKGYDSKMVADLANSALMINNEECLFFNEKTGKSPAEKKQILWKKDKPLSFLKGENILKKSPVNSSS